ncbi:MAG: polyprenyl synthetase family protein [Clostridia bacterium]|nr:polyprenyl synthetase family protein [Clostridia bacterium]
MNYVEIVNKALEEFLPKGDDVVSQAMRYSVRNGGKRIRPVLVLEFCSLCGGDPMLALPYACALEMIHTYSLIHDDLPCMDDDDFRRGKPSCHVAFGEANALLAGDGLLTLAFETAAKSTLSADKTVKAVSQLAKAAGVCGMIGGQVMDLENEGKSVGVDVLEKTDALKTGELIRVACVLGCISAGADDEKIKSAEKYAKDIGLAFQIVDDILDVTGDEKALGKPIGSDADNEKSTYVSALGLDGSAKKVDLLTERAKDALKSFDGDTAFLCDFADKMAKRKS